MYRKDLFEAHEMEYEEMMDYLAFMEDMESGDPWGD
jgi:hypothetical protein